MEGHQIGSASWHGTESARLVKAVSAAPTKSDRGKWLPIASHVKCFRPGAEEPAYGSDSVSRSALFTSPASTYSKVSNNSIILGYKVFWITKHLGPITRGLTGAYVVINMT